MKHEIVYDDPKPRPVREVVLRVTPQELDLLLSWATGRHVAGRYDQWCLWDALRTAARESGSTAFGVR